MQRIYFTEKQSSDSWDLGKVHIIKFPFNIEKVIRWIQKNLHILQSVK